MQVLDGKQVAAKVREDLKPRVAEFEKKYGRKPKLVVVIVGTHQASQVYVRNKITACQSVGMLSEKIELLESVSQQQLNEVIEKLNNDSSIDGILVQLPLPKHLSEKQINEIIHPFKDADGFSYSSLGRLFAAEPVVTPCTPQGIMEILRFYQIETKGKHAVVVGRSNIVGKPVAALLTMADATVTLCHSRTSNLQQFTKQGDIVVVAIGKKHFLGKEHFKEDAVVIDVGIHGSGEGGRVTGDVRFEELQSTSMKVTPVPGGVGPMTIAMLLTNTLQLAEHRMKLSLETK